MKIRSFLSLALCTVTLVGVGTASLRAGDKDVERLQAQVTQLTQELRDLQSSFRQQGGDVAQKMSAVEQIRNEWSGFQGQLDSINQQQQLLLDQLKKFVDEFDGRLRSVEKKSRADAGGVKGKNAPNNAAATDDEASAVNSKNALTLAERATQFVTTDGPAAPDAYREGLTAVQAKDFVTATEKFREYLAANPQSTHASGAQFWLAESLFAQKEWQSSVREYQALLTKFPQSPKIATALLKQAQAYTELGAKFQAQTAYQKVVARAPNSKEAKQATVALQNLQLQNAASATRTK